MGKYVKLLIFLLPIILFVAWVNWYVDSYGVLRITYDDIAAKMINEHKNVTELSESNANDRYLLLATMKAMDETPDVMVIGSSRVMNFEQEAVKARYDGSFFNAGLSEATVYDLLSACGVMEVTGRVPKTLIIGVDSFIFNHETDNDRWKDLEAYEKYMEALIGYENPYEYEESSNHEEGIEYENSSNYEKTPGYDNSSNYDKALEYENLPVFNNPDEVLKSVNTSVDLTKLLSPEYFRYNIDLLFEGKRFRAGFTDEWENDSQTEHYDGSTSYEKGHRDSDLEHVLELTNEAIETQVIYRMPGCYEVDEETLMILDKLIKYYMGKGVKVELYLPPYSPMIYEYMISDDMYDVVIDIENAVRDLSSANGVVVYGSYSPYGCNLQMSDMYDIYHVRAEKMMDTLY